MHPQTSRHIKGLRERASLLERIGVDFPDHIWSVDEQGLVVGRYSPVPMIPNAVAMAAQVSPWPSQSCVANAYMSA